jgi:hypothetical protein
MKFLKVMYQIYYSLPGFRRYGLAGKAIDRLLELTMVYVFDWKLPQLFSLELNSKRMGVVAPKNSSKELIVSITSFPARIDRVWLTVVTLLNQTVMPNRIILWLANEQFPNKIIPVSLRKLEKRGLTIKWCEDIRSHKKFYYTMKCNPDAFVITCDDDVYYPANTIESLLETHNKFPDAVVANIAHRLICDNSGNLKPYMQWKHRFKGIKYPSHKLLQVGVGGVLYPPNVLYKDIFDKSIFLSQTPKSDDVWLKTMALLANTKIVTNNSFNKQLITVRGSQIESLNATNSHEGLKDVQLENIQKYYRFNFCSRV